jgi:hypothetical protein
VKHIDQPKKQCEEVDQSNRLGAELEGDDVLVDDVENGGNFENKEQVETVLQVD